MAEIPIRLYLLEDVRKKLGEITQSVFKFRANVAQANNAMVNSTASFFRSLARLRTAFFILLTFLGVRPVLRFFTALADDTVFAHNKLRALNEEWELFRELLGQSLAPAMERIKIFLMESATRIIGLVTKYLPYVIDLIYRIATIFANIMGMWDDIWANLKDVFSTIGEQALNMWSFYVGEAVSIAWKIIRNFAIEIMEAIRTWAMGADKFGLKDRLFAEFLGGFVRTLGAAIRYIDPKIDAFLQKTTEAGQAAADALELPMGRFKDLWTTVVSSVPDDVRQQIAFFYEVSNQAQIQIDAMIEKLEQLREKGRLASADGLKFIIGLAKGFEKHVKGMMALAEELGDAIANAMETAFSSTFLMIMEGRFNKMKDIVVSFLKDIQKAIADFLAKKAVAELLNFLVGTVLSGISSYFSAPGNTTSTAPNTAGVKGLPPRQEGGLITQEGGYHLHAGEAVIPLKSGKVPVQIQGAPTAGNTVNVTFAPQVIDGPSFGQWLEKNKAKIKQIMNEAATGGDMAVRKAFKLS